MTIRSGSRIAARVSLALVTAVISLPLTPAVAQDGPSKVSIERDGEGFRMLRNGDPYFVKGVCGSNRLDMLLENGGNAIRLFSPNEIITSLNARNLTALVGLNMGKPRQGFDYTDRARVKEQLDRNMEVVRRYMNDPGVLMWAVGNETELSASLEERELIWPAVEETAKAIKAIDPNHPVIVVVAGFGNGKLTEVKQYCPTLDAIGINAYGSMPAVPDAVTSQGWEKAYLITEFGPRGHWEVAKTSWGLPIEDSSTTKAEFYLSAYNHTVKDPRCLGSYAFVWGQKQEKTHTWYGMFLPDGSPLGPVDAIANGWMGRWPANRCPLIGPKAVTMKVQSGTGDVAAQTFAPGARLACSLDVSDPDGDQMKVTWDMRVDVSDNPASGGDREESTDPIVGSVVSSSGSSAVLKTPEKPGRYRIFVYAHDTGGKAATTNIPILVEAK